MYTDTFLLKNILFFKSTRGRNVGRRRETSTECTGAEGPAGTAAVFQSRVATNRRLSYTFQKSRENVLITRRSHNKEKTIKVYVKMYF